MTDQDDTAEMQSFTDDSAEVEQRRAFEESKALAAASQVPALGISYKTILDQQGRREVVYQTYVPQDVTSEELNRLLDKLAAATDRQIAKSELALLKDEEDQLLRRIAQFTAALASLETASQERWTASGKLGAWDPDKLPPKERSARDNTKLGIAQDKERLEKLRTRLREVEEVVDGDGSVSAADRNTSDADR